MKHPSNDLYDLIKSLNQAEKGYFRRHAMIDTKGPETKYNLLFDAINGMDMYDEPKIIEQFKGEAFTKQFPVAKTYLYNRILSALHSYHNGETEEVRKLIHHAEILRAKGLYNQSVKAIRKAKETAEQHNLYFYMPAILRFEHALAVQKYDLKWIERIAQEEKQHSNGLQNISAYSILFNTIVICMQQKDELSEKQRTKKIEDTIKHPLLKDEKQAITFSSLLYYYDAHCFYWLHKGNPYKAKEFVKKRLALYHKEPEKFRHYFHSYLSCMNNLLHLCHETKSYDELEKYLGELSSSMLPKKTPVDKAFYFYVYYGHFMRNAHETGNPEKAIALIKEINKEYTHHERSLNQLEKTVLNMHIALVWFVSEDYNKCLKYLNKIRNELTLGSHPNVERFLHLFYLIVHLEMKNYDLLPHLIKSAYRFLHKEGKLGKFEKALIDFLKNKLPKATSDKKLIESLRQLRKELLPLNKDATEKNAFEFFDYISWLESKIENRPFAEVVREKAGEAK